MWPNMIVKNSALRLYRVSKESQLLKWLEGVWHTLNLNDLPLPAPIENNMKTTLHELAARVSANGPCIDAFPDIPLGALTWNGRVHIISKQKDWNYEVTTHVLMKACRENTLVNIFCDGARSNRGRDDGKQIGATSAVLYQGGRERHCMQRVLGKIVIDSDTLFWALHAGLDALTHFLNNPTTQQENFITISLPSRDAINKALDASPHDNQEVSIAILRRLSTILDSKPDTKIVFLWLPWKIPFAGFNQMKQIVLETICPVDLTNIIKPHTINRQKEMTKDAAVAEWAVQWHRLSHTSEVYQMALTLPPDGKTHHTFHLARPTNTPNGRPQVLPPNAHYLLLFYYRTCFHRGIHTALFSATHPRTDSLPVWRAPSNCRACSLSMSTIHCSVLQMPHCQRPPPKLSTATREQGAHSNTAPVPGGD